MTEPTRYLYRVEDGSTNPYSRPTLKVFAYAIVRETPACYVIRWGGQDKFVLKDPNGKRFAYLSLDDARQSYRRRKERQVSILAHRHDAAAAFLKEIRAQIAGEAPAEKPAVHGR